MSLQRGIRPGALARFPASTGSLPEPLRLRLPAPSTGLLLFLLLTLPFLWLADALPRAAADYASTLVFAFTGALVGLRTAPRHQAPLALLAGFLTANGGGTVRTLILGRIDFFWWTDPLYLLVTAAGAALALVLGAGLSATAESHWDSADRIALGVFAAAGVEKALLWSGTPAAELPWLVAVGFGALTGAGGGLIRDLLLGRPPTALCTAYGPVAVIGAALHTQLYQRFADTPVWLVSAGLIWLLAEAAAWINLRR